MNCGVGETTQTANTANSTPALALINVNNSALCRLAANNKGWETKRQFQVHVKEAKRRGLSCGVTEVVSTTQSVEGRDTWVSKLSDANICHYSGVQSGFPYDEKRVVPLIAEAKRRGLSCGVVGTSATQIATTTATNAQPNTPTSAELKAERQRRIKLEQQLAALKAEQEQRQQTISSDTQKPTIKVAGTAMNGPQGTIKGFVRDNTGIAEVRVDGRPVVVDSYGNFTANTYVPKGGVNVSIEAIDLAGLSNSMSVRLERLASNAATTIRFDRLNPLGRKVASNNDALALIIGVNEYAKTPAKANLRRQRCTGILRLRHPETRHSSQPC